MKYKLEISDDEDIESLKEVEKLADTLGLDTEMLESKDGVCWQTSNI